MTTTVSLPADREVSTPYPPWVRPGDFAVEDRGQEPPWWVWQRTISSGYAQRKVNYKTVYAHRSYYEQAVGLIPEGKELHHHCNVADSVRPEHLEPVTHQENLAFCSYRVGGGVRARIRCLRHEGKNCPRCDGLGRQPIRYGEVCGVRASTRGRQGSARVQERQVQKRPSVVPKLPCGIVRETQERRTREWQDDNEGGGAMSALIRCPECQGKMWAERKVETVEDTTERVSYLCETCGSTGEVPRCLGIGPSVADERRHPGRRYRGGENA
jgi:hypothetical protein